MVRYPLASGKQLGFLTLAFLTSCAAFDDGQAQGCFEQADCPVDSYCDDGVCLLRGEGTRKVIIESIFRSPAIPLLTCKSSA